MQRDKRGRFIKKAQDGTYLDINGKKRKVKVGASAAYQKYKETAKENPYTDGTLELWLSQPENAQWLEPEEVSNSSLNTPTIGFNSELYGFTPTIKPLEMPKLELPWEKEVNPVIQNLGLQNGIGSKI